ncbi:hypothetical protein GJAV_G00166620 [Gymnothorax javanicus]|nr:hypothetical protein GJAV_G00166620 [Gymnothorax javanicus]
MPDEPASAEPGSSSDSEEEGDGCAPSDLGGVTWKEAVELHAKRRGGATTVGKANGLEGEDESDEDEDDDDDDDEEESSDELQEEEEGEEEVCNQRDTEPNEDDVSPDAEAQSGEMVAAAEEKEGPVNSTFHPRQSVRENEESPVGDVLKTGTQASLWSPYSFSLKTPSVPFFPEPFVPDDIKPKTTCPNTDPASTCPAAPSMSPTATSTPQLNPVPSTEPPPTAQPETLNTDTPTDEEGVTLKVCMRTVEVRKSSVPELGPQGRGETGPSQPLSRGSTGDLNRSSACRQNGTSSSKNHVPNSSPLTPPATPPPAPPDEEPASLLPGNHPVPLEAEPTAAATPVEVSQEAHGSFLESVDEIPFADDDDDDEVEGEGDTNTLRARDQTFFTPPKSHAPPDPPLRRVESWESDTRTSSGTESAVEASAIGVAEERIRSIGKSIKSPALREAMEQQLRRMKTATIPRRESSTAASSPSAEDSGKNRTSSTTAWSHSAEDSGKNRALSTTAWSHSAEDSGKNRALLTTAWSHSAEDFGKNRASSTTAWSHSAEDSGKNRTSLTGAWSHSVEDSQKNGASSTAASSPSAKDSGKNKVLSTASIPARETKKQVPASQVRVVPGQGAGQSSRILAVSSRSSAGSTSEKCPSVLRPPKDEPKEAEPEEAPPKHGSVFKAVSTGHRKDTKHNQSQRSSDPANDATIPANDRLLQGQSSDRHKKPSLSEDSDLSCDEVLEKSPSKADSSVYIAHALAFRKGYGLKKAYTEEELNARLTLRVQRAARRQAKREELKRLHRAQIIQRQLEQVEVKQRYLEERGVAVEKALRGEAGMGKEDDPRLMHEWFTLVQEKNSLVRYESELMIFARELELEDRQSRLQQDLRERMAVDDHLKSEEQLEEERRILGEMLEVVEQRDALVALLEEQRLREKAEDQDLEAAMLTKGFNLNWA